MNEAELLISGISERPRSWTRTADVARGGIAGAIDVVGVAVIAVALAVAQHAAPGRAAA